MDPYDQHLGRTLAALADPTRRAILTRLLQGQARISELAAQFPISLNSVSKHVRVLERAGLVRRTIAGREHRLDFQRDSLAAAARWIDALRAGEWPRGDLPARLPIPLSGEQDSAG